MALLRLYNNNGLESVEIFRSQHSSYPLYSMDVCIKWFFSWFYLSFRMPWVQWYKCLRGSSSSFITFLWNSCILYVLKVSIAFRNCVFTQLFCWPIYKFKDFRFLLNNFRFVEEFVFWLFLIFFVSFYISFDVHLILPQHSIAPKHLMALCCVNTIMSYSIS